MQNKVSNGGGFVAAFAVFLLRQGIVEVLMTLPRQRRSCR